VLPLSNLQNREIQPSISSVGSSNINGLGAVDAALTLTPRGFVGTKVNMDPLSLEILKSEPRDAR
jgi:hypothetical protein